MRETVAIICEYNPFHNGHKHQIDKIKERFPNATIVAIMSGNVTQRGEFAMFDKYTRARAAISMGVNAVLELPYPFCGSNAEIFACAGVEIAKRIGADYLCFGSESNDLEYLSDIANTIDSDEFEQTIQPLLLDKSKSYITAKTEALRLLGKKLPENPNDMLSVEYLRAIKNSGSSIVPFVIKREGLGYNDASVGKFMSATGIRTLFYNSLELLDIPENAKNIFDEDVSNGLYLDKARSEDFFFRYVLITDPKTYEKVFDAPWESGFFLRDLAKNSLGAMDFFGNLSSKTYTHARLRRIIMYLVTGVIEIPKNEIFTELLSCDDIGREFIRKNRKGRSIVILTKYADAKKLTTDLQKLLEISKRLDELFYSLLKVPVKSSEAYKKSSVII